MNGNFEKLGGLQKNETSGHAVGARLNFSVVVCNFNYGRYVCEAVDSALAQSLSPCEVVVIDDGSTDGSRDVLTTRYGNHPQVRLVFKKNGGQLAAFVDGVAQCSGAIVSFLDADDHWAPDYLETLEAAYLGDLSTDFIYTNLRRCGDRSDTWFPESANYDHGLTVLPTLFLRHWIGAPTSALSMRLPLARSVLSLPAELLSEWRTGGDDCLVIGASLHGAHKRYLASAKVNYRIHGDNDSTTRPRGPVHEMQQVYKVERLLAHYAKTRGLRRDVLTLSKREFKTRPAPSWVDLNLYVQLVGREPLPWFKRVEHWMSVWGWFWSHPGYWWPQLRGR